MVEKYTYEVECVGWLFYFKRWWNRPLLCKFGFHAQKSDEEVSYKTGSGIMSFHCPRCQKAIDSVPMDDVLEELRELLLGLIHDDSCDFDNYG